MNTVIECILLIFCTNQQDVCIHFQAELFIADIKDGLMKNKDGLFLQ